MSPAYDEYGETRGRRIPLADKVRAVRLAKEYGESVAAREVGADIRSVRRWVRRGIREKERTPQPDGDDFEAWAAEHRPDLDLAELASILTEEYMIHQRDASAPSDAVFAAWVAGTRHAILEARAGAKLKLPPPATDDREAPDWDEQAFVRDLDLAAYYAMAEEREAAHRDLLARRKAMTDVLWSDLYPPTTEPGLTNDDLAALVAEADAYLASLETPT